MGGINSGGRNKVKAGVLFCGGCNCYFDRETLYETLKAEFRDCCEFSIYTQGAKAKPDLIVLINGCQSECLMDMSWHENFLLINDLNYQNICVLFGALLEETRKKG